MSSSFSEWRKLPLTLSELCINTTLRCGQSFRWQKLPENEEWRCVLHGRVISLRQDASHLYYRAYFPTHPSNSTLPTPPLSTPPSRTGPTVTSSADLTKLNGATDHSLALITHYFNLDTNLTQLYLQWSELDSNFKKKALKFTGIRILRQDAWEALVSFICSSNNNISRISQMVEKLCINYGVLIGTFDGYSYYSFPLPETLIGYDVESRLRELGFGYRAKYIHQTAVAVTREREGWLDSLRNPEYPAFGVDWAPGGEMAPEGRQGYREAHQKLLGLHGVGPKVADCVCLMGLGWGEAVPVDTHVWQIAQRDYRFGRGGNRSLSKATYDAVGNHFRNLWGKEAGWAHSVLFTADLRTFSERLGTSKAEAKINQEDVEARIKIKAGVAAKRKTIDGDSIVEDKMTQTRTLPKRLRRKRTHSDVI
ncbi:hypothetical protein Egran_05075 [Elaphomyces granulatus]|uniref:DNA-(apurinic or apyrimidinic site) lyase n=1 Tax=Elaphomyces granulatus TaxID=519963 RepID=A0A232LSP9_9EURO|nr:hypothetical protein Egran_05075 [Elaphomyces granulatus]